MISWKVLSLGLLEVAKVTQAGIEHARRNVGGPRSQGFASPFYEYFVNTALIGICWPSFQAFNVFEQFERMER